MGIVIKILVGLVLLVSIVLAVGLILPRQHHAASRIVLHHTQAEVWPLIRDLGALQGTWTDLESVQRLPDAGGKEIWLQKAGGYELRIIVEEAVEPSKLVTRIDAGDEAAFGGTWTYALERTESGSRLTILEDGYVSNPFFRVMMKVMGAHKTLDGYLTALGKKLGEDVKPEHVD